LDTIEVLHSVVEQETEEGQLDIFTELEFNNPEGVPVLCILDSKSEEV
jgi:hypothetical protein